MTSHDWRGQFFDVIKKAFGVWKSWLWANWSESLIRKEFIYGWTSLRRTLMTSRGCKKCFFCFFLLSFMINMTVWKQNESTLIDELNQMNRHSGKEPEFLAPVRKWIRTGRSLRHTLMTSGSVKKQQYLLPRHNFTLNWGWCFFSPLLIFLFLNSFSLFGWNEWVIWTLIFFFSPPNVCCCCLGWRAGEGDQHHASRQRGFREGRPPAVRAAQGPGSGLLRKGQ